jgi:hypothetical protein
MIPAHESEQASHEAAAIADEPIISVPFRRHHISALVV